MRKLTGYIGAMVIVFALMGTILSGYALNISGQNVTVDNYDKITDVSGLYSYSEEKSYIEYNPASNYTGYQLENIQTHYVSDTGSIPFKDIQGNATITINKDTGEITINGVSQGAPSVWIACIFICDYYWFEITGTTPVASGDWGIYWGLTTDATITINGDQNILNFNGNTYTYTTSKNLAYYTTGDNDYWQINGRMAGNNTNYYAYCQSVSEIVSLCNVNPDSISGGRLINVGLKSHFAGTGANIAVNDAVYSSVPVGDNLIRVQANYENYTQYTMGNPPIYSATVSAYCVWYPVAGDVAQPRDYGISYETTNKVNNYPMRDYSDVTVTYGGIYQLDGLNLNNNLSPDMNNIMGLAMYKNTNTLTFNTNANVEKTITDMTISMPRNAYAPATDQYKNYKLSDILNLQTIPANTYEIKITAGDFTSQYARLQAITDTDLYIDFSTNTAFFNNNEWTDIDQYNGGKTLIGNLEYNKKDYIIYKVNDGVVDFYNSAGTIYKTVDYENCYVAFLDIDALDNLSYGYYFTTGYVNDGSNTSTLNDSHTYPPSGISYSTMRLYASLNFIYYSSASNTQYMDVTKGVSIDNHNPALETIWNNGYENGDVQILFRGEDTNALTKFNISGHDVSVLYDWSGRFYIDVDNGGYVNIGLWRNIILDFDLEKKSIIAYPVKTFNNFTNVIIYDTPIIIGNYPNLEPVTEIKWYNSEYGYNDLKFSIYNTKVFLDTYNVVMVNPSLTITNYYTDLNNFYRLDLYDFAVYGDSISINGTTYPVTNGTITINNETIRLKEISITYSGGNVNISSVTDKLDYDVGPIVNNDVNLSGVWYFKTDLLRGFNSTERVYSWDQWTDFILNDGEFSVIYLGLLAVATLIARRYCTFQIMDYLLMGLSVIISLSVQVIG